MKKNRKGISPLIASVLLIAFTVAIATLIMGWFSTITRSTTTTVSNKTSESISCSNAVISIQDVYVKPSISGTATVIIKNAGFATIGVTGLQVYNTTGHNFSTGFDSGTSGNIRPGAIVVYNITSTSLTTCGTFSKAIVTSSCGGITDTFESVPKCVP